MRCVNGTYVLIVWVVLVSGCGGPRGDEAAGQNTQLKERLTKLEADLTKLEAEKKGLDSRINELQLENTRLQTQFAAATGGQGLDIEERQRLLDDRRATLDDREQSLVARETSVENQLVTRREELHKEYKTREEAVLAREQGVARKEQEFYDKTNLTMEDLGEAKQIKSEFENMRESRNDAIAKAEDWLAFVWYVSIALGIAILACAVLVFVTISKHVAGQRELVNRQEVAKLLSDAIQAQLPPEQGALVVDAFNRLSRIEDNRDADETIVSSDKPT